MPVSAKLSAIFGKSKEFRSSDYNILRHAKSGVIRRFSGGFKKGLCVSFEPCATTVLPRSKNRRDQFIGMCFAVFVNGHHVNHVYLRNPEFSISHFASAKISILPQLSLGTCLGRKYLTTRRFLEHISELTLVDSEGGSSSANLRRPGVPKFEPKSFTIQKIPSYITCSHSHFVPHTNIQRSTESKESRALVAAHGNGGRGLYDAAVSSYASPRI
jgi:hypothetical protein